MTEAEILALISFLVANGQKLGAEAKAAIQSIVALFRSDPTATLAQVQAAITSELAQAASLDKAVEGTTA